MSYIWKTALINLAFSVSQADGYLQPTRTPPAHVRSETEKRTWRAWHPHVRQGIRLEASLQKDLDQPDSSLEPNGAVLDHSSSTMADGVKEPHGRQTQSTSATPTSQEPMTLIARTRRLLDGVVLSEYVVNDDEDDEDVCCQEDADQEPVTVWTRDDFVREAEQLSIGWSYRSTRKAASLVEKLIKRVIQVQQQNRDYNDNIEDGMSQSAPIVDLSNMYTCCIRAWTNSGERGSAERCEAILDAMQQCHEDEEMEGMIEPNIEAFNLVMLCYARSRLPDAPQQALRVLQKMQDWYTSGVSNVAPNKRSYAAILRAFANTGKPDAPDRVKQMLNHLEKLSERVGNSSVRPDCVSYATYFAAVMDSMERDYITAKEAAITSEEYLLELIKSPHEDARPDEWIFNSVLCLWSKAGTEDMVERASCLMKVFEEYHEWSGRTENTRPSTLSYNFLLAAYSRSTLKDKGTQALALLREMQELVNTGENPRARPDAISYNTCMTAFGKSRQHNAPYYVEDLLREMYDVYCTTGDPQLRPNVRSYNNLINSWAYSTLPGSAARIMDWIVHMQSNAEREGRRNLGPNKWTFNAFLQALSKTGEPTMADDAEEVLNQMLRYYQKGWEDLKPDVLTFTSAIHCIAVSGTPDALERSLAIVRQMEDFHAEGFGDARPNSYTYNCVINAAAKSNRPGKAQIALQLLRRMQEVALRPPIVTYNNALNACAFSRSDDSAEEVLAIGEEIFKEAKAMSEPNFITFSAYIQCITRFVKDGTKKKDLVYDVFSQCCEAGQLTGQVMKQLKIALTSRQFAEVQEEATDVKTGMYHRRFTENARRTKQLFQQTSYDGGRK